MSLVFVFHLGSLALLLANVHAVAGVVLLHLQKSSIIINKISKILRTFIACIFFLMASMVMLWEVAQLFVQGVAMRVDWQEVGHQTPKIATNYLHCRRLPTIVWNNSATMSTFKRQRGNV